MKKKRTAGTISWKEACALNKRALCLWLRECPAPFLSAGLYSAITALGPYLTIYFSARLLDELEDKAGAFVADFYNSDGSCSCWPRRLWFLC